MATNTQSSHTGTCGQQQLELVFLWGRWHLGGDTRPACTSLPGCPGKVRACGKKSPGGRPQFSSRRHFLTGKSVPRAFRGSELDSCVRKPEERSLRHVMWPFKSLGILVPYQLV